MWTLYYQIDYLYLKGSNTVGLKQKTYELIYWCKDSAKNVKYEWTIKKIGAQYWIPVKESLT